MHKDGSMQTVAINEAVIAKEGEAVIQRAIQAACASPMEAEFNVGLSDRRGPGESGGIGRELA